MGGVYLYKKEFKTKQITSVSFKHNGTSIRSLPKFIFGMNNVMT